MWGTATVRGEEDTIVRRLDTDEQFCWKSDQEVAGHLFHTDEDVEAFTPHDWSWLQRHTMRNPDAEPFWEWSSSGKVFYRLAFSLLWDSWGLGPSYERQYGSRWSEDMWSFGWSFGPLHVTLLRTWNVKVPR